MPQYQSVFELSSLDGNNGFRINGESSHDYTCWSVASAGDVNGDGFSDLIVGAPEANSYGTNGGHSYVVFGKASGFAATLNLSSLDGNNGFQINGEAARDYSGWSVASAGDLNGDGFDDMIVGARYADLHGSDSGISYVVFGKAAWSSAELQLSALDGTNGFQVNGEAELDDSGWSVASGGDVNGDGFADLIVGAPAADPNGSLSGTSYVVFGKASGFGAEFELSTLDGRNGFKIFGVAEHDYSGYSVASAGDVNGDGYADLILGAYGADPHGSNSGASYVVFGKASGFRATLNLSSLNGRNGFQINGVAADDQSGRSVASAGDINGDGYADLIVGARNADPNSTTYADAGMSYVLFGKKSGFAATVELSSLDGHNGFRIIGGAAGDHSGFSVASAGDFNGDGFDDLLVGAPYADPHANNAGAAYIIFGKATGFGAAVAVSLLDGNNGFVINGQGFIDNVGHPVASAGDLNGDGLDDLIVGAPFAAGSGVSYVIYGALPTGPVVRTGTAIGNTIHGGNSDDTLSGLKGNDVLLGHGGNDMLLGGSDDDTLYGGDGNDSIDGGDGIDTVYGGIGDDRVLAGADFAVGEVVDGGTGTDVVVIDGKYDSPVLAGQLHDVERIEFAAGHDYHLSVEDSLLASGTAILVDGRQLGTHDKLIFDGTGEHDGALELIGGAANDTLTLGDAGGYLQSSLGHDILTAGQGGDQFAVDNVTSTGRGFDTAVHFDFSGQPLITSDVFVVNNFVTGIDAAIAGGTLSKANFDADLGLAADAAHLAAGHAVLFTPDAGNYHNKTFLIVDQNGVAGYQSGGDIVVQLKAPVDIASIGTEDFFTFF